MTRRSLEDLGRDLDEIDGNPDGVPVTFADFYVYYHYCTAVHGALGAGPTTEEFFGGEAREPHRDYWIRMTRIWDGEDDPPIPDDELHTRIEERRQELGDEYPPPDDDPDRRRRLARDDPDDDPTPREDRELDQ